MNLLICKTSDRTTAQGFTLMETLVAMGISALVILVLVAAMTFSGRLFAGIFNYVDMDDSNRVAMDLIARDVRTAQRLVSFSTNDFTLRDEAGANLTYRYNPANGTLARESSSGNKIILKGCERFSFRVSQRTPIDGIYDVFPTANVDNAKVIDFSWLCSRKLLGQRANTESVQTARIVIRQPIPL